MLQYIIEDIPNALLEKGFTSTRIRKEKLLSESTLQKLRNQEMVSSDNIGRICCMLRCDVADLVRNIPTDEEKIKYF